MSTIYQISNGARSYYVRADSLQAAKLRAYKVWGAGLGYPMDIGQAIPASVGGRGYDSACNTVDTLGDRVAPAVRLEPLRGFYASKEQRKASADNVAAQFALLLNS